MASFLRIFYDPSAVFAKVRERGSWLAPLIATALIMMMFGFYVSRTIGVENITRRFFDEHPSIASQMPPEKKEQAIQQSASPMRLAMGSFFGGVVSGIFALIIALILMVMLSIMDRKPRLPQILGTVAWAFFPFVVIYCVMGILILSFTRDPSELDPQSLVATNVASYLDKNTTGSFLYSLCGSFDLLAIGKAVLLGYGLAIVTGIPLVRTLTLVISLWLVWVLLRGGFAAAIGF
jgi:Yip1 domain